MKGKYLVIILLLCLVLTFSGCKGKKEASAGPFKGGTAGVDIVFREGMPFTGFDQGESVPVKVILTNNGEYNLKAGEAKAKLFGLDLTKFSLSSNYKSTAGSLHGVDPLIGPGKQEVDFGNLRYSEPIVNEEKFKLNARVCYPYETSVRADVCLGSRVIKEGAGGELLCKIEGEKIKTGFVSCAPIQVTSITESLRGSSKVVFKIVITNQGTGLVYSKESSCDDLSDPIKRQQYKDMIYVALEDPSYKCYFEGGEESNEGYVTLQAGTTSLSCIKDIENKETNTPVKFNMKLDYMYTSDTAIDMTITEA